MRVTPESAAIALEQRVEAPRREQTRVEAAPRAVPRLGRFPGWLKAIDAIQRGACSALTLGVDLGVIAGSSFLVVSRPIVIAAMAPGLLFVLYVSNIYADRSSLETQGVWSFASSVMVPVAVTTIGGTIAAEALRWPVRDVLWFGAAAILGLLVSRTITWTVLAVARRRGAGLRRTLIVGNGQVARMLQRTLSECPAAGLLPVAMLALGNGNGSAAMVSERTAAHIARSIKEADVEHVVVVPEKGDAPILECVRGAEGNDVTFSILPPMSEFFLHPSVVTQVGGLPLIPLGKIAARRTMLPGKRLFDLVVGGLIILVLSPLLLATALGILIFDGRPIIYRQRRVGRDGKVFTILKFRSMIVGAERLVIDLRDQNMNNGLLFKVQDDPRITRVGRIIRRMSIDELPQLWNVIRGEMSLVGPRPLPVEPEDFDAIAHRRHTVRPGITGLWQVRGGNRLTYEDMVELDLAYIATWSMAHDIRLLFKTVPAVAARRAPC